VTKEEVGTPMEVPSLIVEPGGARILLKGTQKSTREKNPKIKTKAWGKTFLGGMGEEGSTMNIESWRFPVAVSFFDLWGGKGGNGISGRKEK